MRKPAVVAHVRRLTSRRRDSDYTWRMHHIRVISLSSRVRTALHRDRISHAALSCGTLLCGARRRHPLCTLGDVSADTCSTPEDARSDSRERRATKPIGLDADGRLYSYLLQHTREPEVHSLLSQQASVTHGWSLGQTEPAVGIASQPHPALASRRLFACTGASRYMSSDARTCRPAAGGYQVLIVF